MSNACVARRVVRMRRSMTSPRTDAAFERRVRRSLAAFEAPRGAQHGALDGLDARLFGKGEVCGEERVEEGVARVLVQDEQVDDLVELADLQRRASPGEARSRRRAQGLTLTQGEARWRRQRSSCPPPRAGQHSWPMCRRRREMQRRSTCPLGGAGCVCLDLKIFKSTHVAKRLAYYDPRTTAKAAPAACEHLMFT